MNDNEAIMRDALERIELLLKETKVRSLPVYQALNLAHDTLAKVTPKEVK